MTKCTTNNNHAFNLNPHFLSSRPHTEVDVSGGFNVTVDVTLLPDRIRKPGLDNASTSVPGSVGSGTIGDGNCAVVEAFPPTALDAALSSADLDVFDEESAVEPLCRSECIDASGGSVTLRCPPALMLEAAAADAVGNRRRLLAPAATGQLVVSYGARSSG